VAESAPSPASRWLPLVLVAASFGGLVGALVILSPHVPIPPLAGYLVAFAAVTCSAVAAGATAPSARPFGLVIALAGMGAGLGVTALLGAREGEPVPAALVTASLLVGGATLGAAVGGRVEHPGHLLVVAEVSLLVDAFSVFHTFGPAAAAASRPEVIALVALPWPVLGTSHVVPVLGVGDVIFAGLYMAASRRHGLGRLRTALALEIGLLVTGVAVLLTEMPIPALPAMGAAVLVAHPKARKLPPQDRHKGWIVIAVLTGLWLASWLFR